MFLNNSFDIYLFEQYLREKRNLSNGSLYLYLLIVENFLLEYDDPTNLDSYNNYIINHAIKKRSTVAYSALKAFISYKIEDKGTAATMIEALIKPEVKKDTKRERTYLTEKQIIEVINNLRKPKHRIVSLIQDLTGVRAGDVLRIKRGNIQPEVYENNAVLKIIIDGKGGKRNVVFIHDEIVQILIMDFLVNNYLSPAHYFLSPATRQEHGNFLEHKTYKTNYMRYYRDLIQALHRAGLGKGDFATHDYRRCYARRVWTRYKDLHVLQQLLNHANPATTMRYLKHSGMQNIDYHKEMQQ